jgi:hypothetical protein
VENRKRGFDSYSADEPMPATAGAQSGGAAALIAMVNRQLVEAGVQNAATRRH